MALQNVSGLTIRQIESGQELASTCPGDVRFHREAGLGTKSYEVDAGTATPCEAGDPFTSAPLTPTEGGPGTIVLTVVPGGPVVLFADGFSEDVPPVALEDHTPNVGTQWIQGAGTAIIDPSGQATPANANTDYTADPPASSPNCFQEGRILFNNSGGGSLEIASRCQADSLDNCYTVDVQGLSTHVFLLVYIAGVQNVLAGPFNIAPALGENAVFRLECNGSSIRALKDDVEFASVIDATHALAGTNKWRYTGGGSDNMALLGYEHGNL